MARTVIESVSLSVDMSMKAPGGILCGMLASVGGGVGGFFEGWKARLEARKVMESSEVGRFRGMQSYTMESDLLHIVMPSGVA